MTYAKFKPCPFCGGKRQEMRREQYEKAQGEITYFVMCTRMKCGAIGPMFLQQAEFPNNQEELATQAWNRRASC